MKSNIVGWDIGGAHVKTAVLNDKGEVSIILQKPCPLWQGLDRLKHAVTQIKEQLPDTDCRHAVTMTGELVDCFENRDDGVMQIIKTLVELLPEIDVMIYAGRHGFLSVAAVNESYFADIASANWLASASFAAHKLGNGLFIDIGSTTTDILLLSEGLVLAEGYSDYQRLISGELIYTGIVRTAVMAVAQTAVDQGKEIGLMAEYFANMADVYRVTGELNERHDQTDTADGAEKTMLASARRLSRMIGCDFDANEMPRWRQFAENVRSRQLYKIQIGCEKQLSRFCLAKSHPFIGAGIGRFLVRQLAQNLGYAYQDFSHLFAGMPSESGLTASDCAPAVAVASLARESLL